MTPFTDKLSKKLMNPEINNETIKLMRGQIKLRLVGTNLSNCTSFPDRKPVLPHQLLQIVDILRKTKDTFVKVQTRQNAMNNTSAAQRRGFIAKVAKALSLLFRKRRLG